MGTKDLNHIYKSTYTACLNVVVAIGNSQLIWPLKYDSQFMCLLYYKPKRTIKYANTEMYRIIL